MPRYEIVSGLDIGATKISFAALRREFGKDTLDFLGCHSVDCECLSATGAVLDLSRVADAVSTVLEKMQDAIKQNITTVFISAKGTHIISENVRGRINLLSRENEICAKDIASACQNAKASAITFEREPLLIAPENYIVDGQPAIKNPVGLSASRLEVDYLFVTALAPMINNLSKAVNMGGLEVEDVVLSNLAGSFSVLTSSEKDLGVTLIDIGSFVTEISIFTGGVIKYDKMLGCGSSDLEKALCSQLKIKRGSAAKIIKNYWKLSSCDYVNPEEDIFITEMSKPVPIKQRQLQAIIEPGLVELFGRIKDALQASEYAPMASCGIVLTGGISAVDGLAESAESVFNMPVKVGTIKPKFNNAVTALDGSSTVALGLALYGHNKKLSGAFRRRFSENVLKRTFQAAKDFLYDYF